MSHSPLLTVNNTILWLKVIITAATLVFLYLRYKRGKASAVSSKPLPFGTRIVILLAVLFSFAVFHNLGSFRGGTFVHHGEMFHYYLGSKYFKELGYYELYNAVIVADTEQGNALAGLPFYTDLRTYQNTQRETVLQDVERVRNLFSRERWSEFKDDVAFFKEATGMPRSPGILFFLMDHGYNGSPVSTSILGMLTNAIPVSQLLLLALLDVWLVIAMGVLVFRTFGFEMGALFSVYFSVNILNDHAYVSGSLLRYDWLFYIIVALCLLEKRRYALSAIFLTLSAMLRVFPAVMFYGLAITIFQNFKATHTVDKKYIRFALAAGVTGLALALLPAVSLGSAVTPWQDFFKKTQLHDSGVYVNHLGLRGIVLFEPAHLSLERFVEAYKSNYTDDIVRHWQDVKENEFRQKRPIVVFASLLILACLTAIIWKRKQGEGESVLWPLLLIYSMSYPSHYYYAFLCLLIILLFRRPNTINAFVPVCLLLLLNICALVTDYFGPSPIVFYTLVNIYLFTCVFAILGFELYTNVLRKAPAGAVAIGNPPREPQRDAKRRHRRQTRARGK